MQEEPAELVGVLFDGVDKLQHLCWRFIDPTCRPVRPTRWETGDDRALRASTSARSTLSSQSS